jgi:hypothetical protein
MNGTNMRQFSLTCQRRLATTITSINHRHDHGISSRLVPQASSLGLSRTRITYHEHGSSRVHDHGTSNHHDPASSPPALILIKASRYKHSRRIITSTSFRFHPLYFILYPFRRPLSFQTPTSFSPRHDHRHGFFPDPRSRLLDPQIGVVSVLSLF